MIHSAGCIADKALQLIPVSDYDQTASTPLYKINDKVFQMEMFALSHSSIVNVLWFPVCRSGS